MRSVILSVLTLLLLVSPHLVEAQAITGRVRDQTSGEPISGAQVFIEGDDLVGLRV